MEKNEAQIVLRVPVETKNALVKASQADGKKLTEWMVSKAFLGRPSVAQLTNLGINVPIGATSFHTRADGCVGVCVFNVNLSEVYQGERLVTGAEFVEVTLTEKQMDRLKELGWVGSLGFHFWNVGQLGAYGGVE